MVSVIFERTFAKSVNSGCRIRCSELVLWCPTGSVLGPLIFTMYTQPLGIIVRLFGVSSHFYADDTRLYVSLDAGNEAKVPSSLENLEHCIADFRLWMTSKSSKAE